MPVPNIVAFRIDERLIHGQGQLWIKALGVNTVIVANDSASEDAMQQTLMKAVVPKTIAMRFFSIQHTCDVIMKASPRQTIFIVCKTTEAGGGRSSCKGDQCGQYPSCAGQGGCKQIHCPGRGGQGGPQGNAG